jgi:DNA-binding transcriptional MerR regulator
LSVLKTIENIRALQRLGLPLNEIGPIFKISAAGYTQEQLMQFLEERLNVIRGKIAELNEIEGYISGKLNRLREESKPSTGQRLAKKKKPITRRASSKHAS